VTERLTTWLLWALPVWWVIEVGPDVLAAVRAFAHTRLGAILFGIMATALSLVILLPTPEPDDGPSHVTER
jgi:hypothetical protein